jgi:hypothetical protein
MSEKLLVKTVQALATGHEDVVREVAAFREDRGELDRYALAEAWADRIVHLYAASSAATALPGAIPGLGTAAQVGTEAAAITTDLAFMLRCMGRMVAGIAVIYGHDPRDAYTRDLVFVLGLWCNAVVPAREATRRLLTRTAIRQFDRKVTGAMLRRINQAVGMTLFTKYGTKRGAIALGRLIPFGVGVAVGGAAGWHTMRSFERNALRYFGEDFDLALAA